MRLIDADSIYNVGDFVILHEDGNAYVPLADLCKIIDIQPTVYDIDKVVEELEKIADESYKAYCIAFNSDDRAEYDAYTNAIEIVKAGVKNE